MLDATPSIELKTRIGARKKPKKNNKKNKTKQKNRHISKTARIPIGKLTKRQKTKNKRCSELLKQKTKNC